MWKLPETHGAVEGTGPARSAVIGRTLSHYRVTAALGAGGMGQVWRATDTRLDREVAIKVLPPEVAGDPERLSRFQREARLLAALNHPNVAAIHGIDQEEGKPFLVLELVEGEDLSSRIARGPLPVDEAVDLARQIAGALEAAHTKGIVHRDLKPANVKLTAEGKVKVLDFGLAKAYGGDAAEPASVTDVSQSPTLARAGTLAGVILGTAAYMSPEQASGRAVDKRADIWAFGVVLFEMLTGRPLYSGETVSEVLAGVIKEDPPWERLPADCPAPIARLLRRCLKKRAHDRLQHIGDARLELSEAAGETPGAVPVPPGDDAARRAARGARARERWAWAAAAVMGLALAALALRSPAAAPAPPAAAHFVVDVPTGVTLGPIDPLAVSPDGRQLAFVATSPGSTQPSLWIRPLDSLATRPLPGTEGADEPFWSPDSGSVAFFTASELKTIYPSSGSTLQVCTLPRADHGPGTWSPSGTIVFQSGGADGSLVAVPAAGGEPRALSTPNLPQGWPQFLPDGKRVLFVINGTGDTGGAHVLSLDDPRTLRRFLGERAFVRYAQPGHLLLVRNGTLLAQPFDHTSLRITGAGVPVVQAVEAFPWFKSWGYFSASSNGVLAYVASAGDRRQLSWLDRNGRRLGTVGRPAAYGQLVLAPDQSRVAVEIADANGNHDLWVVDLTRGVATRVTFDPVSEDDPVWAPDSRALAYDVVRPGRRDIFRKSLVGSDPPSLLLESPIDVYVKSWSPDGKALVYVSYDGKEGAIRVLHPESDPKPEPLVRSGTGFRLEQPQISPDGRWLAYVANESGQFEVYVQPFRRPGERVRVSTEGGGQALWRGDGKELFYLSPGGKLMAVDVRPGAASIEVGLPRPLFDVGQYQPDLFDYAPSADGQRFLVKVPVDDSPARQIHVVVNWPSLLQ
jgi:Tol biopolymer transport system component